MVESHKHNDIDNPRIDFEDLAIEAGAALTAIDSATLSTGGAAVLSTSDSDVIDNMRTRLNELESRLQAKGLIN